MPSPDLPSSDPAAAASVRGEAASELRRRRLWLAALHHLAIADGDFSEPEVALLEEQLRRELPGTGWEDLHLPGAAALAQRLGPGSARAEQFLRSATVVALADGCISPIERELLLHWSRALQVGQEPLSVLTPEGLGCDTAAEPALLNGLRRWLDGIDPTDPTVARFLVRLIPAQCPFERDVILFGHKLVHIPPMCKINPLYEQLVALRFRCLCHLEEAGTPPVG